MNEKTTKPAKRKKQEHGFATVAYRVVQEVTTEESAPPVESPTIKPVSAERHAKAVAAGRTAGEKGGKARAAKLSPEQRRGIARKAAKVRWAKDADSSR